LEELRPQRLHQPKDEALDGTHLGA
jgi:hypothetical protein